MSVDQGLALVGIVVAVIFGIYAAKKVINRNNTQRQRVSKNSVGIQAARDATTKIER